MKQIEVKPVETAERKPTSCQTAFVALREAGYDVRTGAEMPGYSLRTARSRAYTLDARRQRGLLAPLVPKARKALALTLAWKSVGEAGKPLVDCRAAWRSKRHRLPLRQGGLWAAGLRGLDDAD